MLGYYGQWGIYYRDDTLVFGKRGMYVDHSATLLRATCRLRFLPNRFEDYWGLWRSANIITWKSFLWAFRCLSNFQEIPSMSKVMSKRVDFCNYIAINAGKEILPVAEVFAHSNVTSWSAYMLCCHVNSINIPHRLLHTYFSKEHNPACEAFWIPKHFFLMRIVMLSNLSLFPKFSHSSKNSGDRANSTNPRWTWRIHSYSKRRCGCEGKFTSNKLISWYW